MYFRIIELMLKTMTLDSLLRAMAMLRILRGSTLRGLSGVMMPLALLSVTSRRMGLLLSLVTLYANPSKSRVSCGPSFSISVQTA